MLLKIHVEMSVGTARGILHLRLTNKLGVEWQGEDALMKDLLVVADILLTITGLELSVAACCREY